MFVINLEGYVVRFCDGLDCNHSNELCPNIPGSKFYIPPEKGELICSNIKQSNALVSGHENEFIIGSIQNAILTNKGIVVQAYIDDKYMIETLNRQFKSYTRNYTKHISFFQYLKNIFSGISMSHHPTTWEVNHIGLVNIPARLGSDVKYFMTKNKSLIKRHDNKSRVSDFITAHCVAFLRNPEREKRLILNNKFSLHPEEKEYIYASYDYCNINDTSRIFERGNVSKSFQKPSSLVSRMDFSNLCSILGQEALLEKLLPSLGLSRNDLTNRDPIQNSIRQSKKRSFSSGEGFSSDSKRPKTDNIDQNIEEQESSDKVENKFINKLENKIMDMESKLSQITDIFTKLHEQKPTATKLPVTDGNPETNNIPELPSSPIPVAIEASSKYDISINSDKLKNALIESLFDQIKDKLD